MMFAFSLGFVAAYFPFIVVGGLISLIILMSAVLLVMKLVDFIKGEIKLWRK